MKKQLVVDIKSAVQQEVQSALQGQQQLLNEQIEAIRSAAATPAPDHPLNAASVKVYYLFPCLLSVEA